MRTGSFTVRTDDAALAAFVGRTVKTIDFESPAEYAAEIRRLHDGNRESIERYGEERSWYDASAQSGAAFVEDVNQGGTVRNAAAIQRANAAINVPAFALHGPTIGFSVGAGVPCIPAVLAGEPEYALTITETEDTNTPVRIIYERTTSAAIDSKTVEETAATIAAVARIIQASRPCQIIIVSSTDSGYDGSMGPGAASVRIHLSPFASEAEIGLFVSALGPIRRGSYAIARDRFNFGGSWPFHYSDKASKLCVQDILTDNDVYIPAIHLHDELAQNPAAWAARTLNQVFGTSEPVPTATKAPHAANAYVPKRRKRARRANF